VLGSGLVCPGSDISGRGVQQLKNERILHKRFILVGG